MGIKHPIEDIPLADLQRASQKSIVTGFFIGIDTTSRGGVLKFRFTDGPDESLFADRETLLVIARHALAAAKAKNWNTKGRNDMPTIEPEDWDAGPRTVGPLRMITFDDAVILSFATTKALDVIHVIQIPAPFARYLSELIVESFDANAPRPPDASVN